MFVRHLVLATLMSVAADVAGADEPDYLQLGVGAFDVTDGDRLSAEGYAEYRFGRRLGAEIAGDPGGDWWHGAGPLVGLRANGDGGIFGFGGVFLDIRPHERLVLWPSAGIGGWREGGSRDLGGTFQFHLETFIGYRIAERHMLGVSFQHISNAGLHSKNPGADSVFMTYSIALPPAF
jgi:hypothetical protein